MKSQEYLEQLTLAKTNYLSKYDQGSLHTFDNEIGNLIMPGSHILKICLRL